MQKQKDLYQTLHEKLHGRRGSAKSMSNNCGLGGAAEWKVMKIDWLAIAFQITPKAKCERRQNSSRHVRLLENMKHEQFDTVVLVGNCF